MITRSLTWPEKVGCFRRVRRRDGLIRHRSDKTQVLRISFTLHERTFTYDVHTEQEGVDPKADSQDWLHECDKGKGVTCGPHMWMAPNRDVRTASGRIRVKSKNDEWQDPLPSKALYDYHLHSIPNWYKVRNNCTNIAGKVVRINGVKSVTLAIPQVERAEYRFHSPIRKRDPTWREVSKKISSNFGEFAFQTFSERWKEEWSVRQFKKWEQ